MRKLIAVLLVCTFLVASCIIDIEPSHASEGSWETKTQMGLAKTGFGVGVVNGKIYVLGGHPYDSAQYTIDHTSEYDPTTNQWGSKQHMLGSLAWFGTAIYQNEIYAIGGVWGLKGSEVSDVSAYNPSKDTWTTKASMSTPRAGLEANVVDEKIYVIGGVSNADETVNLNEVYDPNTDMWTTKTPIPTPVSAYASAVVDGKIYVIGGLATVENSTAKTRVNLNQIYDPEMDTWSLGAPLPNIAKSISAGATSGVLAPKRIYVIGDGLNQVYNPSNDSWTMDEPIPNSVNRLTNFEDVKVAVVNDQLYALGGVYEGETVNGYSVNEQYTPIGYGTPDPSYTSPSPAPTPTARPDPFPTTIAVASIATIAVIGIGILAYFKKYKKK